MAEKRRIIRRSADLAQDKLSGLLERLEDRGVTDEDAFKQGAREEAGRATQTAQYTLQALRIKKQREKELELIADQLQELLAKEELAREAGDEEALDEIADLMARPARRYKELQTLLVQAEDQLDVAMDAHREQLRVAEQARDEAADKALRADLAKQERAALQRQLNVEEGTRPTDRRLERANRNLEDAELDVAAMREALQHPELRRRPDRQLGGSSERDERLRRLDERLGGGDSRARLEAARRDIQDGLRTQRRAGALEAAPGRRRQQQVAEELDAEVDGGDAAPPAADPKQQPPAKGAPEREGL